MIPRFLFLLPNDTRLLSFSVQLAERLKNGNEACWIGFVIHENSAWILSGYPQADQTFTFKKTPGEIKMQLIDQLPDYLIDLSDQPGLRLFKNRFKVVDFTLNHRHVKKILAKPKPGEQQELFHHFADQLLGFFEMTKPESLLWHHPDQEEYQKKHLPESFLSGYLAFHLGEPGRVIEVHEERVIKLLSIVEFPTVLIGDQECTEIGDRINQEVGCSVFNAAGVLTREATLSVVAGAHLLVSFDKIFSQLGDLVQKPSVYLKWSELTDDSADEIALSIRKKLDQKI